MTAQGYVEPPSFLGRKEEIKQIKLAFRSKRNRGLNLKNTKTLDSYFLEHSIIVKGKNIVSYTLK